MRARPGPAARNAQNEPPFVVVVTRDISARVDLARKLPGEFALLLVPDQATAAGMLGEDNVRAVLDRPGGSTSAITLGGLRIDTLRLQVTWNGIPLQLTRLERELLARLAEPPVRAWPYERLYRAVWREVWLGDTAALHAATKRLRRKLRDAGVTISVESVRGVGFRLGVSADPRVQDEVDR